VDFDSAGFEWIDCHDSSQSVLSYLRKSKNGKQIVACAFNFTPVPRENYRIGVPFPGYYREAMNSDAELYGGSNVGNRGGVVAEPISWMGRPNSIPMALPPLAGRRPGHHCGHPACGGGDRPGWPCTESARRALYKGQHSRAPDDARFHGHTARKRDQHRRPAGVRSARSASLRQRTRRDPRRVETPSRVVVALLRRS
jgi:hypothetical protein